MEIQLEVRNTLNNLGLLNPRIELEKSSDGRIGGFVISDSYKGLSQIERQNMLWEQLSKLLDKEKQRQIMAILTMTPSEVEEADLNS
jgi:acid stress-induced BolA-like protein IbaG/YrbA